VSARANMRAWGGADFWAMLLGGVLRGLRTGELVVEMPDGREHRFAGPIPGPSARVAMRDAIAARRVVLAGSIGLAEGYMEGAWDTLDLEAVLDLGLANTSLGWAADLPDLLRPVQRLLHAANDNDPQGARRNIACHYDLGNDFYELWLDPSMTYSSACDVADDAPLTDEQLESAQRRKWDRILELIEPARGDHVLEIGCGWGGFALHAAREAGCHVTGLTLSKPQAQLARERVEQAGLEGLIDIRLQDYREMPGTFDRIASIEMFEAVGFKWWPTFFGRLKELLAPGGTAALQTITIAEETFEDYLRHPDFIQRYIFPGGMLPSSERFSATARASGLTLGEPHFFGRDYYRTLGAWSARFEDALPRVRDLGFDESFIRMWRYYLAYCRTGFDHGNIDVMQVRLQP
jgi:cyclopropane-fatty-acyl-phospholipid synthase